MISTRRLPMCRSLAVAIVLAVAAAACTSTTDVSLDGDGAAVDDQTAATALVPETPTVPSTTLPPTTVPPTTLPPILLPDPIELMIGAMTVEEKVGQLLMPVMSGTSANQVTDAQAATNMARGGRATMAELVQAYHLGGVIYLGPNIVNQAQVTALSADLQAANAVTDRFGIDLFISVDQEGGRVARLSDGLTPVPAARSFTPDVEAVRAAAALTGTEVAAQGINVVYAPVADLVPVDSNGGVIGDRSYGSDPVVVSSMVVGAIEGLQSSGVAAVVKHWPGHGATLTDSHDQLPTLDIDRALWESRERVPFVAAIDADVGMVMVGHLAIPALDPDGGASSLSVALVQGLLRDELGYEGVVVTDALDMGAVDVAGSGAAERGEVAVGVIAAGGDVLLAMPDIASAHAAVVAAVSDGRISMERLDLSVDRVLRLKAELGLVG